MNIESSLTVAREPVDAPMVSKISRAYLSTEYERIRMIRTRYDNAWKAHEWEFYQIIDSWKYYFGAIGEQWDEEAIRYKTERHMRVAQYNLIRNKVRTMCGMLSSDEYDGRYDPITGVRNSGVEAVEFGYDCDKELMGYDDIYWQIVLDGLVHVGTQGIQVSTEKDPRGNITFPRELPGRWVTDPDWQTNSIYDCMWAWKQGHMTASQIYEGNEDMDMTPQLEVAIKKEQTSARNWEEPTLDTYDTPFPSRQNTYHVIEEHWIEKVKEKRLVGRRPDGTWVPFPISKNNEDLEMCAIMNGIDDWQENVEVVPYEDRIAHLDRICTELSPTRLIAHGKPEIQVKSIPIVQFTYDRDIAGRNIGMVSDLIDPQKDLNYAKSKRQELLASAQGGAGVYDRNKMPDDEDRTDFEANHNDVTRMFPINGDPGSFMKRIQDGAYSPELIRESEEPFNIVDRISGVSAAASSRTQGSNEPASLFAMKLKVNKVGTLPLDKRLKMLRVWQYQSYFLQFQISYKGPERCFTSKSGKTSTTINERMPDGSIKNKVDELPLCSVTITESEGSLTRQMRDRTEIAAMLQAIPKEYRESIAIMVGQAFKTMDLSEDKKEMVEQAMKMEIAKARIASMAEIANSISQAKGAKTQGLQADLTSMQLEAQLKQIVQNAVAPTQPQEQSPEMISKPAPGRNAPARPARVGVGPIPIPPPSLTQQVAQTPTPMNP